MPNQDIQNVLPPILSEQSLLMVAGAVFTILIIAGISFTIVLKNDPKTIRHFRGGRALHHVTVLTVVLATVVLALERILTGEAVASILGGIIGYVLGSLKQADNPKEEIEGIITGAAVSSESSQRSGLSALHPDIFITHIEYASKGDDFGQEYVRIKNSGDIDIDLSNWKLYDEIGHEFTFPVVTLKPGVTLRIWTGKGINTSNDFYWGKSEPVWNNAGDCAYLQDNMGKLVDTYRYNIK